ncbi:two-component regulator propeller domain-containing protein [Nemorincola caseinilytica]|uniref:Two-component regulator propeller domain-containing protein n=2 Tax=Nemorincola caseinilytica TaxID=2054315 RepID=A0ABP8N5N5_9BACT
MSYSSAFGVATSGNVLYTITDKAFYTVDAHNGQVDAYSKVEGMSDIGMQCIGYDHATSTAVLVYSNGNVDLFKDNTFYNVPDLKIKTIAGSKEVYAIYILNGNAYLSTSIGVVVIDLAKQSIKETYEFNVNNQVMAVKGIWSQGDSLYAITVNGMYSANKNSNELQNFLAWKRVDTGKNYICIAGYDNELYLSTDKKLYKATNGIVSEIYSSRMGIMHIDAGMGRLLVSEYDTGSFSGYIKLYNSAQGMYDSVRLPGNKAAQAIQTLDGTLFIADEFGGLLKRHSNGDLGYITPEGPINVNSFDLYAYGRDLWIAHGGFNEKFLPAKNYASISNFRDEKWKYYARGLYRAFDTITDISVLLKDEKTGTLYAGSFLNGLFVKNSDESTQAYTAPSVFDNSISQGEGRAQVAGLGLDSYGNLWVSTMFSPSHQLYVKTPENEWTKFSVPGAQFGGPLVVDDNDQVWFAGYNGSGVSVYNFNGTPADRTDDASYHLVSGKGYGNLPSNTVNCLAKDNNNNIWIGTANGIGIVSNCSFPLSQTPPCDAEIPIVQYDQYAGYLFAGNNVRTIAVDGANRKWVGTDDGVWLLSPDAGKIVYRFTTDNSPLPSDHIQKIAVDKLTGDVYIGTEQGLVSYRSTATEGGTKNENIISFPNPVPSGYTGTVAIKGLVANADVRITDINGQLVYRTKALGGQAIWNGLDHTGRRPQSGVYLIFASDSNGEETYTGKLVLLK